MCGDGSLLPGPIPGAQFKLCSGLSPYGAALDMIAAINNDSSVKGCEYD